MDTGTTVCKWVRTVVWTSRLDCLLKQTNEQNNSNNNKTLPKKVLIKLNPEPRVSQHNMKMSGLQSKITRHTKNQENVNSLQEKMWSTNINSKITQMWEWLDKRFKEPLITMTWSKDERSRKWKDRNSQPKNRRDVKNQMEILNG